MKALSLKWRLMLPVGLALIALAAIVVAHSYDTFSDLVVAQTDRILASVARSVKTIMDEPAFAGDHATRVRLILAAEMPSKAERSDDDERPQMAACVWFDGQDDSTMDTGSQAGVAMLKEQLSELANPPVGTSVSFDMSTSLGHFRGIWMHTPLAAGALNIAVVRSTTELLGELHELLWDIALWVTLVLVVIIVLSSVLIMLGLRPVEAIAQKLATVTTGNIATQDWPLKSVPDELVPFVLTVREMLNRLDESFKRQKTFVADAAHELRTPLAVAKSTMQVALSVAHSNEEYQCALQEATEDLRRIERLVNELLVLARLDEIDNQSDFQELDLNLLLEDVASLFRQRAEFDGDRLICDLAPARIQGDAAQLSRLFTNLLDNALRHGPTEGKIRLIVRTQDSSVEIRVEDQGGTIPQEQQAHLFDRFYRTDTSRSQTTGGFGLGLAIAKAIVLRHGGQIDIRSEPATGTCVCVRLPAAEKI